MVARSSNRSEPPMRSLLLPLVLLVLVVAALVVGCTDIPEDDVTVVKTVAAWGHETPPYVVHENMFTTTTARARTAPTVRSASAGPAVIAESSIRGFPCGPAHSLPPCYVLRRESMMAVDPPRVWNGNCYMPVGSYGQCGRSTASGLWQVLRSTWKQFGGYVNAADAPVDVQNAFARQLWAGGKGCRAWSAC